MEVWLDQNTQWHVQEGPEWTVGSLICSRPGFVCNFWLSAFLGDLHVLLYLSPENTLEVVQTMTVWLLEAGLYALRTICEYR